MTRGERRTLLVGLAFISPWIVGLLLLTVYPVVATIYYSFCDYHVLARPIWIGTLNYQDMITDHVFWQSLYNTLFYAAIAIPLGLLASFLIAVMLNQAFMARSVFRTIYFLPSMVPFVAVAMIWLWIFHGQFGLLNYALERIGIDGPNWLVDERYTKPALIIMSIWGIGGAMVICLAAIQDVPRQLYESAQLDGASYWRQLWHITVPMISPVLYFNLVMGIIGSLQIFVQPFIMFGIEGGPDRSALFYAVYLYANAFSYRNMGYACAMAWVLFMIILVLTWAATRASRKRIYYAGE